MADEQEPSGNPEVIQALNNAYEPILTAFEAFHRQEHRFQVKYHYKKMQKRYDELVGCARKWRRKILNRIEQLGGAVNSSLGPVSVSDDISTAYEDTLGRLRNIYSLLGQATAVAMSANDHPSTRMLMRLQTDVEKRLKKFEARKRQMTDMGANYLLKA